MRYPHDSTRTSLAAATLGVLALGTVAPAPAAAQEARAKAHSVPHAAPPAAERQALLAGEGMGMARPAELNGYPGPKHVLELAGPLELTEEQQERVATLMAEAKAEFARLGAEIVEREDALWAGLAAGELSQSEVEDQVGEIAELQGRLRFAHIRTHMRTKPLLDDEQLAEYRALRMEAAHSGEGRGEGMQHGHRGGAMEGEGMQHRHRGGAMQGRSCPMAGSGQCPMHGEHGTEPDAATDADGPEAAEHPGHEDGGGR